MDSTLTKKLDDFRKKVKAEAELLIFQNDLGELLDSDEWRGADFVSKITDHADSKVYPSPSSSPPVAGVGPSVAETGSGKKRKRINGDGDHTESSPRAGLEGTNGTGTGPVYTGLVATNQKLNAVLEVLRIHCEALMDGCDKIKLWVNLTMPKIEDGDNFGVQVQEEVLTELHRSQEAAMNLRDGIKTHYLGRGKISSKLLKYPHIEDYALGLKEHDNKQVYMARQHLLDIRNIYAVLTDLIQKNIVKLRAPKSNNGGLLY